MTTITVWNVAKRSEAKLARLETFHPDVAVVPECARDEARIEEGSMVWVGSPDTPGCGLAVISFKGHRLQEVERPHPDAVWTTAVEVSGPTSFRLLAVWADNRRKECQRRERTDDPLGPVRLAVRHHQRLLKKGRAVVAGDFNHNSLWDRPLRSWNHSYAVADLASFDLVSAYHEVRGCRLGAELEPTFFTSRQPSKSHHVDYCFVPVDADLQGVEIGSWEDWCQKGMVDGSDHAPLTTRVQFG